MWEIFILIKLLYWIMINEKQTPEEKEANKIARRKEKLGGNKIEPNIDYKYWKSVSDKRQDSPSNGTFAAMLTILSRHVKEGDILWDVLNDENRSKQTMNGIIKKGQELANEIFPDLKEADGNQISRSDALYLALFDVIQGWGGITGRTPYNKRSSYDGEIPGRHTPGKWLDSYKRGVALTKEGKFKEALKEFESIKGVAISFASKHLWFWGQYFKNKGILGDKSTHIYDTRIAKMLFGRSPNTQDYDTVGEVYDDIISKNNLQGWSHGDVEQALFAFSNTFYDNNLSKFHEDYDEDPISKGSPDNDIEVAKEIFCKRNGREACDANNEPLDAYKDLRSVSDVSDEDEEVTGVRLPTSKEAIFTTLSYLKKGSKSNLYDKIKSWLNNPKIDIEKMEPKGSVYNALKFIQDEPEPSITSAEKAEKQKADNNARIADEEDLKKFPVRIEKMDDDNIKFTGDEDVYNYEKEDRRAGFDQTSRLLDPLKTNFKKINPDTLNGKWRKLYDFLMENNQKGNILNESWNKWSQWATK